MLEPGTGRTPEVKNILFDNYKKLLTSDDVLSVTKNKGPFEKAYLQTLLKEKSSIIAGVTAESLAMLRTRFILDWNNLYARKYPFDLFETHTQMLEEGVFDSYNQWLFGTVQNLAAYQNWINTHPEDYSLFVNYQKGKIYKATRGHYYH